MRLVSSYHPEQLHGIFSKINKLSFIFLNGDYLVETAEPVTISLCITCALGKSVRILW